MRPVLATDLVCAARALLGVPTRARAEAAGALIREAQQADAHRRASGTAHPDFGDGTLAAAARCRGLLRERTMCDPEFAVSLIAVLEALLQHPRSDQSNS